MLVLSGCSTYVPKKQPEKLQTFPKETAPSQVIKTENQWVMLNSTYLSPNYTISVSDNLENAKEIYSVNDVSIWYFEANEKAIVWCEDADEFCTFKAYDFETQKTHTIFQTSADSNFHPENIGIYLDVAYFCVIDYEQEEVRVLAYNIDSETTNELYSVELREEMQPYSIHLENEYLSFMCSDQIKVLNLENNETVYDSNLPSSVEHVFDVSYDSIHDTCALYYADSDSEDIGILKEGEDIISSVFTFAKSHYAYQDKIECHDGHIYWINQANVSGNIADHYTFIDYNYLEHKPVEVDRAFEFCRQENTMYVLRFNKGGNYTHIELCQY
jgi:hypothetical protein